MLAQLGRRLVPPQLIDSLSGRGPHSPRCKKAAAGDTHLLNGVAQAGFAKVSDLARWLLLPSMGLLIVVIVVAFVRGHRILAGRMVAGIAAGTIATIGLEIVRTISFHLGGMPGDQPRLLGVLITDRFMLGPSTVSDVLG